MSEEDKDKTSKTVEKGEHALEKFFDIEEGSTEVERIQYNSPLEKSDEYDKKDHEIEAEAHEIFNKAMTGYHTLESLLDGTEPKYRARIAEVALGYLKTALEATGSKRQQKESLEKFKISREKLENTKSNNTNIIGVGDRNDILKMMRQMQDKENGVIDINPDSKSSNEED